MFLRNINNPFKCYCRKANNAEFGGNLIVIGIGMIILRFRNFKNKLFTKISFSMLTVMMAHIFKLLRKTYVETINADLSPDSGQSSGAAGYEF